MASKNYVLNIVRENFPGSYRLITELYHSSDYFRSLCEDFTDCLQVVRRIESSDKMSSKGYYEEYVKLLDELEKELREKLKQ